MNIWKISLQNIKSKALFTYLSVFTLSLSIALLLGIQQLKSSFEYQMENNLGEIDLIIGAKGSPLQLVLASVLHIDNPTGNILYQETRKIQKNPMVKSAVPIAYGDNYKGFRIVGTTDKFVSLYHAELSSGRHVKKPMEVILGQAVAKQLQLSIGDTFLSAHGLVEDNLETHDEKLVVVGILKSTKKVIDRLIITNLESIWDVHHHDDDENETEHEADDEEKEITSLLITFRNPRGFLTLPRKINKETNMQAALPKFELERLYEFTGVGLKTISWIAYFTLIISSMLIFISLYKMVKERALDLALLRTYGASNFQLVKMIAYEGLTIVFIAFLIGFFMLKLGFNVMLKVIKSGYKQNMFQELQFDAIFKTGIIVLVMILGSILIAIYPILKMNVSTILSNEK